ncbi:MAG TPA: hypothetical protein PKW82_05870 [Spirochaetales bacterium]|nr:hypothetical protein [Spirochaetales bacterium]
MSVEPFRVFELRPRPGSSILLHPFYPGSRVFKAEASTVQFEGLLGSGGDGAADPADLRARLQAALDAGAKADALDRGFAIRLAVASGAFIILYLFLGIVIRDPVPLVDELLVSGLGAVASWFWLERKSLVSPAFSARLANLRLALDRTFFRTSPAVSMMEEDLEDATILEPGAFAAWLSSPARIELDARASSDLDALCAAIEDRIYAVSTLKSARALSEPSADRASLLRKLRRTAARSELPLLLAYARARPIAGTAK